MFTGATMRKIKSDRLVTWLFTAVPIAMIVSISMPNIFANVGRR